MSQNQDFRAIIRIAGADCDGSRRVDHAISKIKGVGMPFAKAVVKAANIQPNSRLGYLTEGDVKKIEDVLGHPLERGIPEWMMNRPRSPETGHGYHLIGADLEIRLRMDVEGMKRTRSWKGIRHSLGLKVRGQRTKTTGRTGRVLGVSRTTVIAAAQAKKDSRGRT